MRIDQITIKDILRFRGETTIDLSTLPPGLIALVGPNGAGKTSLLETVPGTIYRKLPSRRDGADPAIFARSRDAALDVTFTIEGAGVFHARVSIDGQTRGSDAVLEQRTGLGPDYTWIPLNDGKVTTYKKAIAERFPSLELFLTSAFAPQGKGDRLAKMTPGEGQDLFAEFLGLQRYATMSQTAKQAAGRLEAARGRILSAAAVLERDTSDAIAAELEQLAAQLQTTAGNAEVRQRTLAEDIARLEGRLAIVGDQAAAYAAATARIRTLEGERATRVEERRRVDLDQAAAALTRDREITQLTIDRDRTLRELQTRIANNAAIRDRAIEIRAAIEQVKVVDAELATLRTTLEQHQHTVATVQREDQNAATAEATASAAKGSLDRASRALTILKTVPCGGSSPYDTCQFLKDAAAAKAQIPAYETVAAPLVELQQQREQLRVAYTQARDAETITQRAIKASQASLAALEQTAGYADTLAAADARITELEGQQAATRIAHETAITGVQTRHADRQAELEDRGGRLDEAIDRLTRDLKQAEADIKGSEAGNAQAITLQAELTAARTERDRVVTTLGQVDAGRQDLERRRQQLAIKRTEHQQLQARLATVGAELLEWQTLARIFSRDGLPDLEIDAAGPTISALTNEILTACFGPRFTCEIVTQVEKAGGKGMKEEFSIRVLDNEEGGDWRDLSDLSGGEKVIVCEALMNAIAVYVNTRSPMPIRTLWRDETGSALDDQNAVRYIEMLRKVRELGGIHHILFISHDPIAKAMADAQIVVSAGTARLQLPPFEEAA